MLLHPAIALAWLTAFQSAPPTMKSEGPPQQVQQVEIGVRVISESGAAQWAGLTPGPEGGYVWLDSSCTPGSGRQEPPALPLAGWRLSAAVVRIDGEVVWVNVAVHRQWSGSTRLASQTPRNSQVVMRVGDRVALDTIGVGEAGRCAPEGARLEATLTRERISTGGAARAEMTSPGGGPSRGAGSPAGVGAGGRGAAAKPSSGAGGRGVGASPGTSSGAAGVRPGLPYLAELWLVHTRPDRTEETLPLTTRFSAAGATFTFPVVKIQTGTGDVSVLIAGSVGLAMDSAPPKLRIGLRRDVTGPFDTSGDTVMGLSTALSRPFPKPTDVVAFELPSVKVPAGTEIVGHEFAVRLRVTTPPPGGSDR